MTDLAAEGDRLSGANVVDFKEWLYRNWPAIAAALRERDELAWELKGEKLDHADSVKALGEAADIIVDLRVRAETAEGDRLHAEQIIADLRTWCIDTRQGVDVVPAAADMLAAALRERDELVDWKATALIHRRALKELERDLEVCRTAYQRDLQGLRDERDHALALVTERECRGCASDVGLVAPDGSGMCPRHTDKLFEQLAAVGVRAETAEADADRLAARVRPRYYVDIAALAAHAAAVEARP